MSTIAFVTGANKGIGHEVARQLGHRNFKILVGARDANRAAAAVGELQLEGIDAHHIIVDVGEEKSVAAAAQ